MTFKHPLFLAGADTPDFFSAHYTYQHDEHDREGPGATWPGHLLYFGEDSLGGKVITPHDGLVAGAVEGHPLYLIFWGGWWNSSDGAARRAKLIDAAQTLIAGPYFSALQQYGIPRAPLWGGEITVTSPGPPVSDTKDDTSDKIISMLEDLIHDGKLPAKDTRPRPIHMVCMPDSYTCSTPDTVGWHSHDAPLVGAGSLWYGVVRPDNDPDHLTEHSMITLTHEVVETMTNPEGEGWHTDPDDWPDEVSDTAESKGNSIARQTACMDGVWAEAYWSAEHGCNVLPLPTGYKAWLTAHVEETSRQRVDHGTFRPPLSDNAACGPAMPACCTEDRDYGWRLFHLWETAVARVHTGRFMDPHGSWFIGGQPVSGEGTVTVPHLATEGFSGRDPVLGEADVELHYKVADDGLSMSVSAAAGADFEVRVSCAVVEGPEAITGKVLNPPTVSAEMMLDFKGADLVLDDAYVNQRLRCIEATIHRALELADHMPPLEIRPGDPIDQLHDILKAGLPAHVRPSGFAAIRRVEQAARAAAHVLDAAAHRLYVDSLVAFVPALARRWHGE